MVHTIEHEPVTAATEPRADTPLTSRRRVLNFAWHFGEMCLAMCLAWMLLALPFVAVGHAMGYADPVQEQPEIATLVAAVAMSIGMAAQMRWRGHDWRCIAEMSGAMVVEALLLIALANAGAFPRADLFTWFHALMPMVMVGAMAFRLEVYTGPVSHRRHAAQEAAA